MYTVQSIQCIKCQTRSKRWTDRRTETRTASAHQQRPLRSPPVDVAATRRSDLQKTRRCPSARRVCQGRPSYAGIEARCFREILEKKLKKIRDEQIRTRHLISWLSGKSLKYRHQMSHFKAKMHQIRFLASVRASVRPSARSSLRWSLTVTGRLRCDDINIQWSWRCLCLSVFPTVLRFLLWFYDIINLIINSKSIVPSYISEDKIKILLLLLLFVIIVVIVYWVYALDNK